MDPTARVAGGLWVHSRVFVTVLLAGGMACTQAVDPVLPAGPVSPEAGDGVVGPELVTVGDVATFVASRSDGFAPYQMEGFEAIDCWLVGSEPEDLDGVQESQIEWVEDLDTNIHTVQLRFGGAGAFRVTSKCGEGGSQIVTVVARKLISHTDPAGTPLFDD